MVAKIWTLDPDEDKLMALLKQEVDMRSRLYNYPITLEAECYTSRPAVATVKLSNGQRQSIALEYVLLRILVDIRENRGAIRMHEIQSNE